MAQPDHLVAEEDGQDGDQDRRPQDAAGQRDGQGPLRPAGGLPEGDHQDVVPRQEEPAEVGQAFAAHEVDELRVIGIEDGEEITGEEYDQQVADDADQQKHLGCEGAQAAASLSLSGAGEVAEHWLEALRHAQEQGQDNEHQVADDQIGRQADFSKAMAYDGEVVDEGDDADGELHDEGRKAQGIDLPSQTQGHRGVHEI